MLVGFKARNHPQQTAAGPRNAVDDRWTPLHIWIPLDLEFGFTLDAAASDENHLCDRYYTLERSGLAASWAGERVWCNPPYSALSAWVSKAHREVYSGRCPLVVMLAPANRTEQRWWQETIEPHRDRGGVLSTRFLPERLNSASRDNLGARYPSSAPFGCVLLVWRAAAA